MSFDNLCDVFPYCGFNNEAVDTLCVAVYDI